MTAPIKPAKAARLKLVFPGQLTDEELCDWLRGNGYGRIADQIADQAHDEQGYAEGLGCWRYAEATPIWRAVSPSGATAGITDNADLAAAFVEAGYAVYPGEVEWAPKPLGGRS